MPETEPGRVEAAVVVHGGREHRLGVGQRLTFGRGDGCTICLDPADRGISRLAGSVEHEAGTWWVANHSGVRPLTVVDDLGIRSVVAPERRVALIGPVTIVVDGSTRRHALEVHIDWPFARPEPGLPPLDEGGDLATSTAAEVTINDQDRLALAALFAGYLEAFPRYDPHPRSYADAAATLRWPRSTLVKRIEYVRVRLTNAGVPNLVGESALEQLAEWALTTRVLTRDDLELLRDR